MIPGKISLRECLAKVGCTSFVFHECEDGAQLVFTPNGGKCPRCKSVLKSMNFYMRRHCKEWRRNMNGHCDELLQTTAAFALFGWFVFNSAVVMALVT